MLTYHTFIMRKLLPHKIVLFNILSLAISNINILSINKKRVLKILIFKTLLER